MATLKLCPSCNKESVWKVGRCVDCNRFGVKLHRHLKDEDEDVVADWGQLSREKKNEVFRNHHNDHGVDLNALLREVTEEIRSERLVKKFSAKGHMKDMVDLAEKYKNKPDQLEAIKKTTYKFHCTIRNVMLYADPEYTQETVYQMEQERKRTLSIATEQTKKRAKVDKPAKVKSEKKAPAEDEGPTDLEPKDKEFIDGYKKDMVTKIEKFDADMVVAKELEEFMAPAFMKQVALWRTELGLTMDIINLAISSGKVAKYKDLKTTAAEAKKAMKTNTASLSTRIKQAKTDKAASE